jgi:hypothetical protein
MGLLRFVGRSASSPAASAGGDEFEPCCFEKDPGVLL